MVGQRNSRVRPQVIQGHPQVPEHADDDGFLDRCQLGLLAMSRMRAIVVLRPRLPLAKGGFRNEDKSVGNPTAGWVFRFIVGIYVLILGCLQECVLNLNEHCTVSPKKSGRRKEGH